MNPKHLDGVADNTQLMFLHDAALLHNLRTRFNQNQIYTFTAHILIAVNPYKSLPLYNSDTMEQVFTLSSLTTVHHTVACRSPTTCLCCGRASPAGPEGCVACRASPHVQAPNATSLLL